MKEIEEDARSQNDQPIHNHGVHKYDCEKCHITKNNLRFLQDPLKFQFHSSKNQNQKKKKTKIQM